MVLPAILRSDPDIVLIGEIRDRTTAQNALPNAAKPVLQNTIELPYAG